MARKNLYLLDGKMEFDDIIKLFERVVGRPITDEERAEAIEEWTADEPQPTPRATNSRGEKTILPAKPKKEDFTDREEWEEALAGWNHRVLPLLRCPPR